MDALEAYEMVKHAELLHGRLEAAREAVARARRIGGREKDWLTVAVDLLGVEMEGMRRVLDGTRMLPELLDVRLEFAGTLQQRWVDALEKLVAGVTFHAGSRAPLLEALLPHLKFPNLRKANREAVAAYHADFEKRLKLSYVQRMFSEPAWAFAPPCVEAVRAAFTEWQSSFSTESLDAEQSAPLREELCGLGEKLAMLTGQARLLAEAALLPMPGTFAEHGLDARPRKRGKRTARADATAPAPASSETTPPAEALPGSESEPATQARA
ncbi:MAG: hypothetical protein FJ086_19080 [Deltaproteobacteria bacterium]|nr:hypothetical protein [Deltaproteobacteria bacterium]